MGKSMSNMRKEEECESKGGREDHCRSKSKGRSGIVEATGL
jgi:hypothetical protein